MSCCRDAASSTMRWYSACAVRAKECKRKAKRNRVASSIAHLLYMSSKLSQLIHPNTEPTDARKRKHGCQASTSVARRETEKKTQGLIPTPTSTEAAARSKTEFKYTDR
eukprot:5363571-Pleurochrysis_carterae.AAC.6